MLKNILLTYTYTSQSNYIWLGAQPDK